MQCTLSQLVVHFGLLHCLFVVTGFWIAQWTIHLCFQYWHNVLCLGRWRKSAPMLPADQICILTYRFHKWIRYFVKFRQFWKGQICGPIVHCTNQLPVSLWNRTSSMGDKRTSTLSAKLSLAHLEISGRACLSSPLNRHFFLVGVLWHCFHRV